MKNFYEMRILSFPFLARPSQGPATWLVKFCNCDDVHKTQRIGMCVLVKFLALK